MVEIHKLQEQGVTRERRDGRPGVGQLGRVRHTASTDPAAAARQIAASALLQVNVTLGLTCGWR
jgi:hypothetical protein